MEVPNLHNLTKHDDGKTGHPLRGGNQLKNYCKGLPMQFKSSRGCYVQTGELATQVSVWISGLITSWFIGFVRAQVQQHMCQSHINIDFRVSS